MLADLHVHTNRSDGLFSPKQTIKQAIRVGLGAMAITDHDVNPPDISNPNIIIVPGVEVSTNKGHVLLLGAKKAPQKGIEIEELVDIARENDYIIAPAHPFDIVRKRIGEEIFKHKFNAIEAGNCSTYSIKSNKKAMIAAIKLKLPMIAGSDAHCLNLIGRCYTILPDDVSSVDDVIDAIKKGLTKIGGKPSIMGVSWCLTKTLSRKILNYAIAKILGIEYNFYRISI